MRMNPKQILYEPIRVSFKKKVRLRDLTPKNNILKEILMIFVFPYVLTLGIVVGAVLFNLIPNFMKVLFTLLLLSVPWIVEVFDDRKGDKHIDLKDLLVRTVFIIGMSFVNAILVPVTGFLASWITGILLATALFSAAFPPIGNLLRGQGPWELSDNPRVWPDNWQWWRSTPWYGRLFTTLALLGATLVMHFKVEALKSFSYW